MPDKSDNSQPSIEKLTSEGVSIRKCIASGDDYGNGNNRGSSGSSSSGSKPKGALGSVKMGKGY